MNRKSSWTLAIAIAALCAGSFGSASAAGFNLDQSQGSALQVQDRYDNDRDGRDWDGDGRDFDRDRGDWRDNRDGRHGRGGWLTDRELRDRVSLALDRRLGNAAQRIDVRVANRDVYLSGVVRYPGDRLRALQIANSVRGVDDVNTANLYVRRNRY